MSDKNDADVHFVGQSFEFPCPECGERLWMFIPADDGPVEIMRRCDIPPEEDDEEVGTES